MARHGARNMVDPSFDLDEALRAVVSGEMALWSIKDGDEIEAAALVQGLDFGNRRTVHVVGIAGARFHEWADDLEAALIAYRDKIGAEAIESWSRPGVVKWLKRRGWKEKASLMRHS